MSDVVRVDDNFLREQAGRGLYCDADDAPDDMREEYGSGQGVSYATSTDYAVVRRDDSTYYSVMRRDDITYLT